MRSLKNVNGLGREECAKIARDVYIMCRVNQQKLEKEVNNNLNIAPRHDKKVGLGQS